MPWEGRGSSQGLGEPTGEGRFSHWLLSDPFSEPTCLGGGPFPGRERKKLQRKGKESVKKEAASDECQVEMGPRGGKGEEN